MTLAPPETIPKLTPGSPEWKRLVTPSKIGAMLNLSPWGDQYSLWHYMRGNIEQPETDEMRRGNFHEEGVLSEFFHRHPTWTRLGRSSKDTIQVSEWFAVTPDELALDDDGLLVLVEAKTSADLAEWGEPGTDEVPEYYYAQVLPAMHGIGAARAHVFVLGPFWEYHEYVVNPDPELAEATLAECHRFWLTVQSGDEPELCATAASYETWTKVADPTVGEGKVEIPADLATELRRNAQAKREAEAALPPLRAQIVNIVDAAGAKYATVDGEVFARRQKNSHGGTSLVEVAAKKPKTKETE